MHLVDLPVSVIYCRGAAIQRCSLKKVFLKSGRNHGTLSFLNENFLIGIFQGFF